MYVGNVHRIENIFEALQDEDKIKEMRESILDGDVYVVRSYVPREKLLSIREYMTSIGRSSLPNYRPVERGAPNFHRMDRWDPRAHVKCCFHSFSFFPWNQDVFNLFELFAPIYHLKNRISDLAAETFLSDEPDLGCTARIAFHCYPVGSGGLNRHQDPFDYHQITVPIMQLSEKGTDFISGGVYVERETGEQVVLDDICEFGDIVYFNSQIFHGVARIDPEEAEDWTSFKGRWMALFAVNKLSDNDAIGHSVDLEEAEQAAAQTTT